MSEPLPKYSVKAVNTSTDSDNKIHDDATARRYGFAGGLVPGVTVYAYLTEPLVEAFGTAWLHLGSAVVKFVKPVLDGEEVTVSGDVTARDPQGATTASLQLTTASTGVCATLEAAIPAGSPTPLNLALYAETPLPAQREPGTRAWFDAHPTLGTFTVHYDAAQAD